MSRKPDFILKAIDNPSEAASEQSDRVGAAWINYDEKKQLKSISIILDPFIVLKGKGHNNNLTLTLFPRED